MGWNANYLQQPPSNEMSLSQNQVLSNKKNLESPQGKQRICINIIRYAMGPP